MKVSVLNKILFFQLFFSILLFGDAPVEKYHVTYSSELKQILKETIGILTINSGVKGGRKIETYSKNDKDFKLSETLDVIKETTPVSNFGWQPILSDSLVTNYRYPVTAENGDYLEIVYDAKKGSKTWVNTKELEKNFYLTIIMIDSISTPLNFWVDIFYFTNSGKRKVYEQPNRNSNFKIISKKEQKHLLEIIEQKGEFIKLGIVHYNYETSEDKIEPIGWVRTRDNEGMLMFWIKLVDFY